MAINSSDNQSNNSTNWSAVSLSKKPASCNDDSLAGSVSSRNKRKLKSLPSPYLSGDKVKLHSRVTEKKLVHRKTTDYMSSFPLAVDIYKANSDEFKVTKRVNKKTKKYAHTLPNDSALLPQPCTVSDMNDSEYNETKNSRKPKPKVKKRRVNKNPNKNIEIYDRDARYCSQLNINLDSSSTDMFKHLTGDVGNVVRKPRNCYGRKQIIDKDVWTVLKNLNKIQFIPSPPMSINSIESLKKKKKTRKRPSQRTDTSYIETCRTEEFAYISYDSTSLNSNSRSSSFDRVTVIGRQDEVKKTCAQISNGVAEPIQKFANQKKSISRVVLNNNKINASGKQHRQQPQDLKKSIDALQGKCTYTPDKSIMGKEEIHLQKRESVEKVNNCELELKPSTLITDLGKLSSTSVSVRHEQLNGITRVVLSKGKDVANNNTSKQLGVVRKPRLVTTMPSNANTKLSQADIKRRLANLKFPIIVNGKDQINYCIKIVDYEPPQFSGLDKQIWPFMRNWLPESQKEQNNEKETTEAQKEPYAAKASEKMPSNSGDNDMVLPKKIHDLQTKYKSFNNHESSFDLTLTKSKGKPIRQFRDKMMNLVYNKSHFQNINTKYNSVEVPQNHVTIETQTYFNKPPMKKEKCNNLAIDNLVKGNSKTKARPMWSKAKWASDFIENVIKKIKCGVYYGQEYQRSCKYTDSESKSTQTENCFENTIDVTVIEEENDVSNNFVDTGVIPGFDDTTTHDLQLETITKNRILVKNCNTNVVVQFDITIPFETNGALQQKESVSFLPIEDTQSKVYKYKTTIMNAVLPAELCSIFPKMLNNIFDSHTVPILPKPINEIECHNLFPIKELTRYESVVVVSNVKTSYNSLISQKHLQNGRFSSTVPQNYGFKPKILTFDIATCYAQIKILSEIKMEPLFTNTKIFLDVTSRLSNSSMSKVSGVFYNHSMINMRKENTCTALIPYKEFTLTDLILTRNEVGNFEAELKIYPCFNFHLGFTSLFKLKCFGTKTVVSVLKNLSDESINNTMKYLNVDLLYQHFEVDIFNKADQINLFNQDNHCDNYLKEKKTNIKSRSKHVLNNLHRSKVYVKLCKKCKSTSSIPYYKKNTPLQKIANLDEFFQALGSGKNLAGVIDGNAERKIFSYIVEMKTWIADMTPRQALLILLLANKKESSNLIHFRNVLLQGIALNRITKSSELDMEIDVIEKENLDNTSLFEGISYVPASVENQDNLLEELCWIAKTTASDFKKPFDKSSVRLLKSLLSKRKKLNPSYLRVMARYVGLGLLTSK